MKYKILLEISKFCECCASHECCPEDECILFRIEKLILEDNKKKRRKRNEK